MWLNSVILFITAFGAGMSAFFIPNIKESLFKLMLVFAGAFLVSITIIHILPELFYQSFNPSMIGLFVLIGFFMQYFLELMTSGVEHGHMHQPGANQHVHVSPFILLFGLGLHSIMEGSLLAHPSNLHDHGHASTTGLLLGIVLHKMPAAFALMSILSITTKNRAKLIGYLTIFAIASPLGLIFSDYMTHNQFFSQQTIAIIFAIVSGNFLKISTTILFETAPLHRFNLGKIIVSGLGALFAIAVEFVH
jgi:zinc and cadmium transporter